MEKIKFIADSASDIPDEQLLEYDIDMPSVPITVDGIGFYERKSFSIEEFYKVLAASKEIPTTSRIPVMDYLESYKKALAQGYTDIINVTINAGGSGTYTAAIMAKDMLYNEVPHAQEKIRIHVVDSGTYSMAYGFPVLEAAKMAHAGKNVAQILAYLDDYFSCVEVYLACYSLEYARKSGRIGAASAFVGDVLGVRPIIALIGGTTKIMDRVRGERLLPQRLVDLYTKNCVNESDPVFVMRGEVDAYGEDVQAILQKRLKRSIPMYRAGASIVINSGPRISAIVMKGKKRSKKI